MMVFDGLLFNIVNCMVEDCYGYLWIVINDGLVCYDGCIYCVWCFEDGLCDNCIWMVLVDVCN